MGFVSFQLVLSSLEVPGARAIVWIQNGDSEACRSAFRSDVDHDSEMKPISIPI